MKLFILFLMLISTAVFAGFDPAEITKLSKDLGIDSNNIKQTSTGLFELFIWLVIVVMIVWSLWELFDAVRVIIQNNKREKKSNIGIMQSLGLALLLLIITLIASSTLYSFFLS